ncbi:hypothetical protein MNV49_000683 [Pseudohyphozyma bogoriensis]|nr:hypothetical protein MNV49_000683 [Pseudohyphozyma bogoriensis]
MGRPIFSPGFHTALSRDHARQLDAALSTAQIHDSDEHHHSKHLHEPTHHDDPARTDPFAHQPPIREQFLSPTSPEGIQVILQGRTAHLSPLALSLLSRVDHAVLVQGRRFEERRTEEGWVYVHIHGDKGELEIVGELVGAGDEQEGETSESESDDDGLMAVDNSEAGVREREARSAMRRSRFTIDVPFHSSHVAVPRTGASFVGSAGRPRLSPGPGLTPSGHRPHPPSRVDSTDPANIFSAPRPSRLDLPGPTHALLARLLFRQRSEPSTLIAASSSTPLEIAFVRFEGWTTTTFGLGLERGGWEDELERGATGGCCEA